MTTAADSQPAVEQAMQVTAELLDHLVTTSAEVGGLTEYERWLALFLACEASAATRATLVGALASAVIRITAAESLADQVYRDAYRIGRAHAGGGSR